MDMLLGLVNKVPVHVQSPGWLICKTIWWIGYWCDERDFDPSLFTGLVTGVLVLILIHL